MKAENIKIDLKELKKFKEENARERLKFIEFWAKYVREHSDEEWGKQQNALIDSQIKNN